MSPEPPANFNIKRDIPADHGADLLGRLMDRVGVRNVHQERHEAVPELSLQTIGVSLLPHGTEHPKSL